MILSTSMDRGPTIRPAGLPEAAYDLMASAPGLAYDFTTSGCTVDQVQDFVLTDLQKDGFESGDFAALAWQLGGPADWTVTSDEAHEGVLSARSGAIDNSQSTTLALDYYVTDDGPFSFWCATDTEPLTTTSSSTSTTSWRGPGAVRRIGPITCQTLQPGLIRSDGSTARTPPPSAARTWSGSTWWSFPGTGVQPSAAITLNETELALSLDAATTGTLPLQVGNDGTYILEFAATEDVSWLDVTPIADVLYPGLTGDLTVTFNAKPVGAGTHQTGLRLTSNDPAHPDTTVTVTMTVNAVTGAPEGIPTVLTLGGAVPNPFNPATDIQFSLPADGRAALRIYDLSGRLVRTLFDGVLTAGPHTQRWNGRDDTGREAASGVYFARLVSQGEQRIKSMALVR